MEEWLEIYLEEWINGQIDEAINPNKVLTVISNTFWIQVSHKPLLELCEWTKDWKSNIPQASSPLPLPQSPFTAEEQKYSFWKAASASDLHVVAGPSILCIHTQWGTGFTEGKSQPGDLGVALWTPAWGSRHPMPRYALQPSPTTVVCFLNKPWDRAMWGYKSAGNQMLTCK